jgi:hypothetical protein
MDVLPHHICFKQEGWSKDTSQLPDIDVSSIKKYLINSKAQKFTVTSLGHFKLSRAYQHLDANHICNVSFNQLKHSSTFCAIKASCIPSQSGNEAKIKHVHVIMDKHTGEPYGGFCTCTVGLVYWKKQLCIEKKSNINLTNAASLHVFYKWILSPKWHSIIIPKLH